MTSSPYQCVPSTPCILHRQWLYSPAAVVPEIQERLVNYEHTTPTFSSPMARVPQTPRPHVSPAFWYRFQESPRSATCSDGARPCHVTRRFVHCSQGSSKSPKAGDTAPEQVVPSLHVSSLSQSSSLCGVPSSPYEPTGTPLPGRMCSSSLISSASPSAHSRRGEILKQRRSPQQHGTCLPLQLFTDEDIFSI